jgi:hypothetical protein
LITLLLEDEQSDSGSHEQSETPGTEGTEDDTEEYASLERDRAASEMGMVEQEDDEDSDSSEPDSTDSPETDCAACEKGMIEEEENGSGSSEADTDDSESLRVEGKWQEFRSDSDDMSFLYQDETRAGSTNVGLTDTDYFRLTETSTGVLIVVPLSLLHYWERELCIRMHPPPKILMYRKLHSYAILVPDTKIVGTDGKRMCRFKSAQSLQTFDVVLTTYDIVRMEYEAFEIAKQTEIKGSFPLLVASWLLVVLEGGHKVANAATAISRAAALLHARYRVVMTGTPVMNNYPDAQGLMTFLKIKPWIEANKFHEVSPGLPNGVTSTNRFSTSQ